MECPYCKLIFFPQMTKIDLGYQAEDDTLDTRLITKVTYKFLFCQLCPKCNNPLVYYKKSDEYLVRWNENWLRPDDKGKIKHGEEPVQLVSSSITSTISDQTN